MLRIKKELNIFIPEYILEMKLKIVLAVNVIFLIKYVFTRENVFPQPLLLYLFEQ